MTWALSQSLVRQALSAAPHLTYGWKACDDDGMMTVLVHKALSSAGTQQTDGLAAISGPCKKAWRWYWGAPQERMALFRGSASPLAPVGALVLFLLVHAAEILQEAAQGSLLPL